MRKMWILCSLTLNIVPTTIGKLIHHNKCAGHGRNNFFYEITIHYAWFSLVHKHKHEHIVIYLKQIFFST